jgi:hypothetical protein
MQVSVQLHDRAPFFPRKICGIIRRGGRFGLRKITEALVNTDVFNNIPVICHFRFNGVDDLDKRKTLASAGNPTSISRFFRPSSVTILTELFYTPTVGTAGSSESLSLAGNRFCICFIKCILEYSVAMRCYAESPAKQLPVPRFVGSSALKMNTLQSFETSVTLYQSTSRKVQQTWIFSSSGVRPSNLINLLTWLLKQAYSIEVMHFCNKSFYIFA